MYPKPPREFMPKQGDIITPRDCSLCGYPLAEYRGVLEEKPFDELSDAQREEVNRQVAERNKRQAAVDAALAEKKAGYPGLSRQQKKKANADLEANQDALFKQKQAVKELTTWFFCNYEHQSEFHARHAKENK